MFPVLRKNQNVTLLSHAQCGGRYTFSGYDKGGVQCKITRVDPIIESAKGSLVIVEFEDGSTYRMLEAETKEYHELISNVPKRLITLPNEFYVESTDSLRECLRKADFVTGSFDFQSKYIIKTEEEELTDGDELPAHFNENYKLNSEAFFDALESIKVFDLLMHGFFTTRNESLYEKLFELFPLCFVNGENWETYGESTEYTEIGGRQTLQFHRRKYFEDENCLSVARDNLRKYLEEIERNSISILDYTEEIINKASESKEIAAPLKVLSTKKENKKKLFKF